MVIKGRDIIVVGLQAWDNDIGSNCKNIAAEFAKHNRVLYINYPLDRISIKRDKNKESVIKRLDIISTNKQNLIKISNTMWNLFPNCIIESVNWLPFTFLFRFINKKNNKLLAFEIQKAIDELQFKDVILFNDSDMFRSYHLKEMLNPAISVYYTRDNMMSVKYWYKHGSKLEPELMAKSDVVCANSTYLTDLAKPYNTNSFYVGQGCDVSAFDMDKITHIPSDIAHIKSPIIGYIGALFSLRLDIELLEFVASIKPEWSIVLIGPEDDAFKKSKLHNMTNVHFLGLKSGNELPDYLARFDVSINPQILNETTIGNYPRKIDEYLAMGKATVATETKAMSIFSEHTYLGKTKEDYIVLIQKALDEDNDLRRKSRIEFARSHTWENSVAEIYKAINFVSK